MFPQAAQRSGHEGQAHPLFADASERQVHDAHRKTHHCNVNPIGQKPKLREADDQREQGCNRSKNQPVWPSRGGMREEGSRKGAAHEKHDRNRRRKRRRKVALPDLVAGLRGVSAHEGQVGMISYDAVGIDDAGDQSEGDGFPLLLLRELLCADDTAGVLSLRIFSV